MKLIIHTINKDGIFVNKKELFKDIPTLGIAFTCIDNWCSDNNRNIVTFDDLQVKYPVESIWVTTSKNNLCKDDLDILFELKK